MTLCQGPIHDRRAIQNRFSENGHRNEFEDRGIGGAHNKLKAMGKIFLSRAGWIRSKCRLCTALIVSFINDLIIAPLKPFPLHS